MSTGGPFSGPVVVAYSADEYGAAALDQGVALARAEGAPLVVVNATRGDALVDRRYAHDADIAAMEQRLREEGVDVTVRHESVPDIADAVVDAAREVQAGVVVVGIRRRSPMGKALLGSVAQRVIIDAECPVLSVKPPRR
jgi:nucleotide-binding universal stress UspA family protein